MSVLARVRRVLSVRPGWRAVAAAGAVVAVLLAAVGWAVWPDDPGYATEDETVTLASGPDGDTPVRIETRLYLPDGAGPEAPVPAVLLAHGFGGSRDSVAGEATRLAERGFAVLAWTARGFGGSGGRIHLNHPEYEVRDAQRLVDWLAQRPEIRADAPGDPRVGVVGDSYGGALALMLAAYDDRVDAVVPRVTWHDLAAALFPDADGGSPSAGVFKRAWTGQLFGIGAAGTVPGTGTSGSEMPGAERPGTETPGVDDPEGEGPAGGAAGDELLCGRFAAELCALYQRVAVTGAADAQTVARLRESSPIGVAGHIAAPTLLVQGESDSLFPLAQADANAEAIARAGTPVRVAWFTGGHDGGAGPRTDRDRVERLTDAWLDHYVAGEGGPPPADFSWSRVSGFSGADRDVVTTGYAADTYPGLRGTGRESVPLVGPPQPVARPPDGTPAPVTALPGVGTAASVLGGAGLSGLSGVSGAGGVAALPGQHAVFASAPLSDPVEVVGAPRVRLRAASPTGEAVLFLGLYEVDGDAVAALTSAAGQRDTGGAAQVAASLSPDAATLTGGRVAPVRLTGLPTDIADAEPVTVTLPAFSRQVEPGSALAVTVAGADQAFASPEEPTTYTVALGGAGDPGGAVSLPTVSGTPLADGASGWWWVLAGAGAAVLLAVAVAVFVARWRHRRVDRSVAVADADTPLVVRGLRKEYGDGFVAVARMDLRVERDQVVGLLGPNGAGKTTALRVLMGLTWPTEGEVRVFGHRLTPGAPVLSRVGALVEGPGFLPHLSGLDNLTAFWRATGRPAADAHLDDVLEIAGLGEAVHRPVHTYSHGMKQRLAIAQAMLGMPEVLVLDEPTDGLDPPQIAEMRRVLHRYATGGRAVLVSSHLLAEVEQTCTHVVVMHRGEIVADGPVDDVVGESRTATVQVDDADHATRVLAQHPQVRSVRADDGGQLAVEFADGDRASAVAALVGAGVGVDRVVPRRRLEDAFLTLVGEDTSGSGDR